MAKVFYTAAVSDMKGKLSGSVFQGGPYGSIIRRKVTPTNQRTNSQLRQRQVVQYLTQHWQTLSSSQRKQWESGLPIADTSSSNGNTIVLSGLMLYVRINSNLMLIGQPILEQPPTTSNPKYFANLTLVLDSNPQQIDVNASMPNTSQSQYLVAFASRGMRSSVAANNQQYKFLGSALVTSSIGNFHLASAYQDAYGALIAGTRVFVKAYTIDQRTGIATLPTYLTGIVAS